jgi:hypothetical protein
MGNDKVKNSMPILRTIQLKDIAQGLLNEFLK